MKVVMFKAGHGDCFLLCLKKNDDTAFNILIDGGTAAAFDINIKNKLFDFLQNNTLDLVIVTHSDNDHIMGILKLFRKLLLDNIDVSKIIKRVIINYRDKMVKTNQTIINNANTSGYTELDLTQILRNLTLLEDKVFINDGKEDIYDNGISITFISPDIKNMNEYLNNLQMENNNEENSNTKGRQKNNDYSYCISDFINDATQEKLNINNRISIALLIKEEKTKESILMLGDSDYSIVNQKLKELGFSEENKLKLDYVKLSHHGSICNMDKDFLNKLQCNKFLISTDGLAYQHPDKKTLARIWSVNPKAEFYFNYPERINLLFNTIDELVYKQKCREFRCNDGYY